MTGTKDFIRAGPTAVLGTALDVSPLTKGENAPSGTRALLVGVAGTINVITATGATRNGVPVSVGVLPLAILTLLTGGTATGIWVLV